MWLGICFMHYIGMLAFQIAMPFEYDWPTVWNAASGALRPVLEPR
jgi:NO-binding membrane sensor protein with MHYT domain